MDSVLMVVGLAMMGLSVRSWLRGWLLMTGALLIAAASSVAHRAPPPARPLPAAVCCLPPHLRAI